MKRATILLATAAFAAGPPKPVPVVTATPSAKFVRMNDSTVYEIKAKLRYDTLLVFHGKGEVIKFVGAGDSVDDKGHGGWDMLPADDKMPTNLFHIKPTVAGAESNLNIQTNLGTYSFLVKEITKSCPGCAPDVKVFIEPIQQEIKDRAAAVEAETKAADNVKLIAKLETQVAGLQTDVLQQKQLARSARRDADDEADKRLIQLKKEWPQHLRWDYHFKAGKEPFNVGRIYTDGEFTYIESGSLGVESIYAVRPDGVSLVQYSYERGNSNHVGRYVINGIITRGYLQSGKKQRLKFAIRG